MPNNDEKGEIHPPLSQKFIREHEVKQTSAAILAIERSVQDKCRKFQDKHAKVLEPHPGETRASFTY
ncbi:TPA: hypothetical protein DCR79_00905 [Patescibacteria group bacterium]|nr:hypothetical protein [Patescibacteria group bacterium]